MHSLRYLRRAAEAIERHLAKEEEVPLWVQAKIQESAMSLGMAVSYLRQQAQSQQQQDGKEKT